MDASPRSTRRRDLSSACIAGAMRGARCGPGKAVSYPTDPDFRMPPDAVGAAGAAAPSAMIKGDSRGNVTMGDEGVRRVGTGAAASEAANAERRTKALTADD